MCLLFLSLNFLSLKAFPQDGARQLRWEAGFTLGPSFFLGDLGGNAGKGTRFIKDVNLELTKIVKGGFVSVYPNNWLGFRLAAQTGYLEGQDDIINTNGIYELFRKQRNLDFKSSLSEAYIVAEVFPLMFLNRNSEEYSGKLQPYVSFGFGMIHFNPQGSLTDANGNKSWYYLKPLNTEGQGMAEYPNRKPYSLTQPVIPIGGGFKYFISERVNISLEILTRKSFTDYIDDVSTSYINPELFDKYLTPQNAAIARQIHDKTYGIVAPGLSRIAPGEQRGNPKQNDSFFSVLTKVGFRLGSIYENGFSKTERSKLRCPARF
ncbi:MAG: hypothetical protein ABIO55_07890 [Ginsengibacter sp.]